MQKMIELRSGTPENKLIATLEIEHLGKYDDETHRRRVDWLFIELAEKREIRVTTQNDIRHPISILDESVALRLVYEKKIEGENPK